MTTPTPTAPLSPVAVAARLAAKTIGAGVAPWLDGAAKATTAVSAASKMPVFMAGGYARSQMTG